MTTDDAKAQACVNAFKPLADAAERLKPSPAWYPTGRVALIGQIELLKRELADRIERDAATIATLTEKLAKANAEIGRCPWEVAAKLPRRDAEIAELREKLAKAETDKFNEDFQGHS